jgi:hypothetical protein
MSKVRSWNRFKLNILLIMMIVMMNVTQRKKDVVHIYNKYDRQLKFCKVMALPALNYASENWVIYHSDNRKTESAVIRSLRSVANYNILDQRRGVDTSSEL